MKRRFSFEIAGVKHHLQSDMVPRGNCKFRAEPTNPYDSNAIGIYLEDGRLLGYVPRDKTALFRAWAAAVPFVEIGGWYDLDITESGYVRSSDVTASYNVHMAPDDNPLKGKIFYINRNTPISPDAYDLVASFGATSTGRLSKSIDYVLYDAEYPEAVAEKLDKPGYKFQLMSVKELRKQLFNESEHNPLLFGKVVSPETRRESDMAAFLGDYLISEGAIYQQYYSNRLTDVVIQWDEEHPTQTIGRAQAAGKPILQYADLLPELYKYYKDEANRPTFRPQPKPYSPSRASKKEDEQAQGWLGCAFIAAIAILVWIFVF
ncbi:MAG: HIRAN domain-containing protein [Muribaculaceae bacterium]|nr:HIRAN domain-containing protein [Muribaculaceae bacterium]